MSKYCTNCGKPLEPGVRFCTNCGAELSEDEINNELDLPKPHKSMLDEADGTPGTLTQIVNELNNLEVTEPVIVSEIPEPEPEPEPVKAEPAPAPAKKTRKKKKAAPKKEEEEEEIVRYKHRKWPWILLLIIALLAGGTWWLANNRPDILDKGLEKITEWTGLEFPKFDTSVPEDEKPALIDETPRPEMTSDPAALGNALGTVRVKVTSLHIRTQPTTSGDLVTDAKEGATYTFYDIQEADSYTWYRIGKEQWIADNGDWLEVTKF